MAKIVSISKKESELIQQAKNNNRLAQKILFNNYAPKMLSICRYYIKDLHFAEDIMLKGFYKAFIKIDSYQHQNQFYSWLKRIMTNECIDFIRSKTFKLQYAKWEENLEKIDWSLDNNYNLEELQNLIDDLPNGCKMVFNLYVLEDYKHYEIAEKLNISVGTSKSQLAYAKKQLKLKLKQSL